MADSMSEEATVGLVGTGFATFFGTIDLVWLKSYEWSIPAIPYQPQLGFFTVFAAIAALGAVVALVCFGWCLLRNSGPLFSFVGKVSIGTWRVLITLAVAYLLAHHFGINIGR